MRPGGFRGIVPVTRAGSSVYPEQVPRGSIGVDSEYPPAESPGFLLTKQDSSTASCMLEQTDQFGSVKWEMPG